MGTRGTYGLRKNGMDRKTYNHSDSYPSYLGVNILEQIKRMGVKRLNTLYDRLEMVDSDRSVGVRYIQRALKRNLIDTKELEGYGVQIKIENDNYILSNGGHMTYYTFLRTTQGELEGHEAFGLMTDGDNFINDSLYCEWGYIINLDTNMLEVYRGFQSKPHKKGRYAEANPKGEKINTGDTYYSCALVMEYPLDCLPTSEEFVKDMEKVQKTED